MGVYLGGVGIWRWIWSNYIAQNSQRTKQKWEEVRQHWKSKMWEMPILFRNKEVIRTKNVDFNAVCYPGTPRTRWHCWYLMGNTLMQIKSRKGRWRCHTMSWRMAGRFQKKVKIRLSFKVRMNDSKGREKLTSSEDCEESQKGQRQGRVWRPSAESARLKKRGSGKKEPQAGKYREVESRHNLHEGLLSLCFLH